MIVIFKTSVAERSDVEHLKPFFDQQLKNVLWNFDLEDCDKILRIESQTDIKETTIKLLRDKGYDCEELPY